MSGLNTLLEGVGCAPGSSGSGGRRQGLLAVARRAPALVPELPGLQVTARAASRGACPSGGQALFELGDARLGTRVSASPAPAAAPPRHQCRPPAGRAASGVWARALEGTSATRPQAAPAVRMAAEPRTWQNRVSWPPNALASRRVVLHVTIPMNTDTRCSTLGTGVVGGPCLDPARASEHGGLVVCGRGLRGRRAGGQRGDCRAARAARTRGAPRHGPRAPDAAAAARGRSGRHGETAASGRCCSAARWRRASGLQPGVAGRALPDRFAHVVVRIAVQRCRQRRTHRQQDDEQAGRYAERASERAKH